MAPSARKIGEKNPFIIDCDSLKPCRTSSVALTVPYPVSANRYWRPVRVGAGITIVPTVEAKAYKAIVLTTALVAGIRSPIAGRVTVEVKLNPAMPLNGHKRMARDPAAWDDSVRALDLDNALKVLLDAIQGVLIDDDKWVRRIVAERFEPDGAARVELRVKHFVSGAWPPGDRSEP